MTTKPLSEFYNQQLQSSEAVHAKRAIRNFTMTLSNAGEMGTKNGIEVLSLVIPAKLAKLHFSFHPFTFACTIQTSNIFGFRLNSSIYNDCRSFVVDGDEVPLDSETLASTIFESKDGRWQPFGLSDRPDERYSHQLGGMDAILRSKGTFSIVLHSLSEGMEHTALQISRNLCQYYAADTDITRHYKTALNTTGNIISIAIGEDLPSGVLPDHPIALGSSSISIQVGDRTYEWSNEQNSGLAALFLRPLAGKRLELVVWGVDEMALQTSARPMPMLTGGGQPDFVITQQTMMWKGIEGTLALGFFDRDWNVSQNSYLAV
jgi:hypothetical protein